MVTDDHAGSSNGLRPHTAAPPEDHRVNLLAEDPSDRRQERADAARNRARVLEAAERLFSERDPRTVTMRDIARAAKVGRATLYRRYPDPAAVAVALLDEHERILQDRLISGPPPLGPGCAPTDRLIAFIEAMLDLVDRHLHLALRAETGASRLNTGAYRFFRSHVRSLVREADVGSPEAMADILLAPLAPDVYEFQRGRIGLTKAEILDSLTLVARRTMTVP
ncbi:TetR/AcrR family transcriptional regulator [Actinoalloteichus hymeniacidonis]|uniref:Transcriptional regulator, TetR family n=1 Tax=Actinoalloteichus hymeniacidonis TaxID=340345 RepID=A0AAC9MYQ8_9PSEU|nr:TetR/AcrR family transcriptional regulator [Actinoalloteichus hymeniacidonis]AOS64618.1 transcriptional regulator, TetR family [Actinoalloteichus hymeniacidonis]MBB5907309.1 AcrR family transcriptional regulator [Actinoalloteichus hymeniacidonis]